MTHPWLRLSVCPWCGRRNELHCAVGRDLGPPELGCVSICVGCHRLSWFAGPGVGMRRPSEEEYQMLLEDPGIRRAIELLRGVD